MITKWIFSTGMLLFGGGKGDCLFRIFVIFLGMIIFILFRSFRGESVFFELEEIIIFSIFFSFFVVFSYLEDKMYKILKLLDIMVDFFLCIIIIEFLRF